MQNYKILFGLLFCLLITKLSCQAKGIDIGLHDAINRLYISANQDFKIQEGEITILEKKSSDAVLVRSSPAAANSLVIASAPDLVTAKSKLTISCKETKEPCILQIKTSQEDTNKHDKFRGTIVIVPSKESFTVINHVDLEDYLKSVVPSEMQASWPLEALKAQAVAARTYTLAKLGRRKNLGYDLKPTVEDQMYLGYNHEDPRSTKAVEATKGKFLVDKQGNFIDAYYSAHSGQASSMPEHTWQISPKHYLVASPEPSDDKRNWQNTFSKADLESKLKDLKFQEIAGVSITERSPEGRARQVMVSGLKSNKATLQHHTLTGEEFRHHLGLASTYFSIKNQNVSANKNYSITLEGSGHGHGVGMSQYGAKRLAEKGRNYEEILGHFYKKAKLAEFKN